MKESDRARQAWNDYLAMGDDRSLRGLLAEYQNRTQTGHKNQVPTTRWESLSVWSQQHGWQQRLAEIAEQQRAAIVARGIADKQNRVDAYNDRWRRMHRVIEARAADYEMAEVPGGKTGLLVQTFKMIGKGKTAELVREYAVDTGLLREMREVEKQAAQEMGDWQEVKVHTGRQDQPIVVESRKTDDAVRAAETAYLAALGIKPSALGSEERDDHPPDQGENPV